MGCARRFAGRDRRQIGRIWKQQGGLRFDQDAIFIENRVFREATMIFRQLFDSVSGTYTYLMASRRGGEALIIDPVLEKVQRYIQLIKELDLKLVKAVDTH